MTRDVGLQAPRRPVTAWATAMLTAAVVLLAGCAAAPRLAAERPVSSAVGVSEGTALGRLALAHRRAHGAAGGEPAAGESGLRLLPSGVQALSGRLALIERAERSLDIQTYHLSDDNVGRAILGRLAQAARRGVRVRLLVDDLYSHETEPFLRALAAEPNVEIRLYNPFPAGRGGLLSKIVATSGEFDRFNRRMHNKVFVADGAVALAGGRNLGAAYYQHAGDHNFIDLDVVAVGPVVDALAASFDAYWSSPVVDPIQAWVAPFDTAQAMRERFEQVCEGARVDDMLPRTAGPDLLGQRALDDELADGRLTLHWARAEVAADTPDRAVVAAAGAAPAAMMMSMASVRERVVAALAHARGRAVVVSPYLVPGPDGLEALTDARRRGADVWLVTNSLATTDERVVHVGYRRYREPLLRSGVEIYEFTPTRRSDAADPGMLDFRRARVRLHAKLAIVDDRELFVGSMNFDPRSQSLNTEIGLFIHSPALAAQADTLVRTIIREGANRVGLDADGRLMWFSPDAAGAFTVPGESGSGFLDAFLLQLLAPWIAENLL